MLEGGRSKNLGEFETELLLVEVAQQKEGKALLVCSPISIAYCAFDGGVQRLDVYPGGSWCGGLLDEVRLQAREVGEGAGGEGWRGGDVHVIGAYGA